MTDPNTERRISLLERDNADMRTALEAVGYYDENGDYWHIENLKVAAASALRFLRNQDGAGFGTTKMEGSEFYMWASCIASELHDALGEG